MCPCTSKNLKTPRCKPPKWKQSSACNPTYGGTRKKPTSNAPLEKTPHHEEAEEAEAEEAAEEVEAEEVAAEAVAEVEETPLHHQAPEETLARRRQKTLWTTSRRVHRRQVQDKGVPDAMGTVPEPQSPLKHHGSALLVMYALSNILQRATYGDLGLDDRPRPLQPCATA